MEGEALRWIVELLRRLGVPFQAVGGLAARAYGGRRPLQDLDFYVPNNRLGDVADAASTYVVRPPLHYRDKSWDLVFMKMEFHGCEIELGGADGARLYDRHAKQWRAAEIDFTRSIDRVVFDVSLPTMPLNQLIAYKQMLGRDVDYQDITEISAQSARDL